jgi:hypothetical protein
MLILIASEPACGVSDVGSICPPGRVDLVTCMQQQQTACLYGTLIPAAAAAAAAAAFGAV